MAPLSTLFTAITVLLLTACPPLFAADINDTLSQIERMAAVGEQAERSLSESIAGGIEQNPTQMSKALVLRLNDKKLTDQQVAIYVWALGLTRDRTTVSTIEALHTTNESDLVKANCLRALASIGGQQAGDFLLSTLNSTADEETRFEILNLLGQMQYEAALPKAEEILAKDIQNYYWQSIFVFGKMGDKAVPFLLERLNHKDRNIRANAINVLGRWLIAPEAVKPLQERFWTEKDTELRGMILSSLEHTIPDLAQIEIIFQRVAAEAKDAKLIDFARETLGQIDSLKAIVEAFAEKKQPSAKSFQTEYARLFKSAGKKGSYELLGISSTADDELELKALRERILQRNSDEAFHDYQKVNGILLRNRWAETLQNEETSNKAGT